MEVHDRLAEQAAPYALGALTAVERADYEAHLAVCAMCSAEVRSFGVVTRGLALAVSPAIPSRTFNLPSTPSRVTPWLALAASLMLVLALGGYAWQLRRSAGEAQSTAAVLGAPDLVRIDLAGQPAAPSASARALWSRTRGLVFTASNLPAPPEGRGYQLWVLTKDPAPMSAGMLPLDANGRAAMTIETPRDMPQPVAIAVTLEPAGGVPAPTGDTYLVGLAN